MLVLRMRGERGFTLLEIMVSLAILAIALVTILQVFSGALRSARLSHDYSLAVIGARKKMEEILSVTTLTDFDELSKAGDFEEKELTGYNWEVTGPEEYELPEELRKDIEDVGGNQADIKEKLYKVGVKVTWKTGGKEKEVNFTTLKILEEEKD